MRPGGASLVLVTFAETKVARLPGRTPATIMNTKNSSQWILLEIMVLLVPTQSEVNGNAYKKFLSRVSSSTYLTVCGSTSTGSGERNRSIHLMRENPRVDEGGVRIFLQARLTHIPETVIGIAFAGEIL